MNKRFVPCVVLAAIALAASTVEARADCAFAGGVSERIRHEYWKNITDMSDDVKSTGDRNFFRFRTSVWGEARFDRSFGFFLKLTNENKSYAYWGKYAKKTYHYDVDEVVVDNLYFDIKDAAGLPLALRVGRQDLAPASYGEGFIFADGTPLDGSRTNYFNAVKAAWNAGSGNSIEFLYMVNPMTDTVLPVINRTKGNCPLNNTDETGYALYHTSDGIKGLRWENYYIYKAENDEGSGPNASPQFRQKTRLNTVGSFAKYTRAPFTVRLQCAGQFGTYGPYSRTGTGGYAFIDRDLTHAVWQPKLTAGYIYLSGDNKNTGRNEGWDPLFSRSVYVSELYSQAFTGESAVYYWTNLQMYRAGIVVFPAKKAKVSLFYNFLRANELVDANASYAFSGTGKTRGHDLSARMDYTFNKNLSAYFLAGYFIPGNFYADEADPAVFLRTHVEIRF